MLANTIISQQISVAAAQTISERLLERLGRGGLTATAISKLDLDQLREVGISRQKGTYLLDLAQHVDAGDLNLKSLARKSDDVIVEQLTVVKGIGVWTAQMFLIFSLGRLDVLPVGDYGIRKAIQQEYELAELPSPKEIELLAQPWRPYATIASWYLWQSLDAKSET
jgi:DNA-3-methyladenine glycosylase II